MATEWVVGEECACVCVCVGGGGQGNPPRLLFTMNSDFSTDPTTCVVPMAPLLEGGGVVVVVVVVVAWAGLVRPLLSIMLGRVEVTLYRPIAFKVEFERDV